MSTDGMRVRAYAFATAGNLSRWQRKRPNPIQRTPLGLFNVLDDEFHFTLDGAASDVNHLCERYYTVSDDSLGKSWQGETVWLNPPFGAGMREWMRKAYEESRGHCTVVALVPSATDMGWWHEYALAADEVRFVQGRIAFLSEDGTRNSNAFFPVSLLVFKAKGSPERHSLL